MLLRHTCGSDEALILGRLPGEGTSDEGYLRQHPLPLLVLPLATSHDLEHLILCNRPHLQMAGVLSRSQMSFIIDSLCHNNCARIQRYHRSKTTNNTKEGSNQMKPVPHSEAGGPQAHLSVVFVSMVDRHEPWGCGPSPWVGGPPTCPPSPCASA